MIRMKNVAKIIKSFHSALIFSFKKVSRGLRCCDVCRVGLKDLLGFGAFFCSGKEVYQ